MLDYRGLYQDLHESTKMFPGGVIKRYVPQIKALVERFRPTSILDYGSGKGYQYLAQRIHEQWGGPLPHCYDIGVRQIDRRPDRKFDGVINVDMMEHIATPDVDEVLADVLGYAKQFAFIGISCRPSKKLFPDGTNVHLSVYPPEWWEERFARLTPPGLHVERAYETAGVPVYYGP